MKLANANAVRAKYMEMLSAFLAETEDVGVITSNSFNFPVVSDDGEEGWVEIVVKIPKEDEGYEKRQEFEMKTAEKAEKKAAADKKKAEKIAKDAEKRKAKAEKASKAE